MGKLQFKKIEIYGTDLSQFDRDRNSLTSDVFILTQNETLAIKTLLTNWINARQDDNYKLSKIDFCINVDEAKQLIEKLKTSISYEKC
jgi:hypothetical protein